MDDVVHVSRGSDTIVAIKVQMYYWLRCTPCCFVEFCVHPMPLHFASLVQFVLQKMVVHRRYQTNEEDQVNKKTTIVVLDLYSIQSKSQKREQYERVIQIVDIEEELLHFVVHLCLWKWKWRWM